MAVKSETSHKLRRLAEMDRKDLGRKSVARLFGISEDAVYSRFKKRGLDFHLKRDVARVLRQYKPVFDEWHDVEAATQETGIDKKVLTYWSRDRRARKEMGVRNTGMRLYIHHSWVDETAKKLQRAGGYDYLIQAREAATILGVEIWKLGSVNLRPIQFTGKESRRYYPQDRVLKLKERVRGLGGWENLVPKRKVVEILDITRNKVNWLGLQTAQFNPKKGVHYFRLDEVMKFKGRIDEANALKTTREVAAELDLTDEQVLRHIKPTMKHPLTREPRYSTDAIEKNRNLPYAGTATLTEILDFCDKNIHSNEELREKVKQLVYLGRIPTVGKDGTQFVYLSRDSENAIKAIYQSHKLMAERGVSLLTIMKASSQMPISENQLRHLVDFYGYPEALSSGNFPSTRVYITGAGKLAVPYVVYTPGARSYFLTSEVARQLNFGIKTLQRKLAKEGKELRDTPWRMQLANTYYPGS